MLEELPVPIGDHAHLDTQLAQPFQHFPHPGFKGFHSAIVIPVVMIKGFVGNLLGVLILTEQHFKNIGAGDFSISLYLGMQFGELSHVSHQAGIFRGFAVFRRHHPVHQPQLVEIRQHVIHRVVHGIKGVHQSSVPVEQDHRRANQFHHRRVPVRLNAGLRPLRSREGFRAHLCRAGDKRFGMLTFQQGE